MINSWKHFHAASVLLSTEQIGSPLLSKLVFTIDNFLKYHLEGLSNVWHE